MLQFNIFAETSHTFSTYKRKGSIFLFYLDLELFGKIKTSFLHTFINNSISKQDKKNFTNPFVEITK